MSCGVDVNWRDEEELTPLHIAMRTGSTQAAQMLIKLGAHVDALDVYGRNALIHASEGGHTECGKIIVRAKQQQQQQRGVVEVM